MNVTFLIGNGFDINLGLNTKYKNFVDVYCNDLRQDDGTIHKFKKDIIQRNLPLWSNAEWAFGNQTSQIKDHFTVKDYCKCHEDFCVSLANYLKEEQKKFVMSKENARAICEKFSTAINNLSVGFRNAPRTEIRSLISKYNDFHFNFIDFNYTDVLDRICSETSNSCGWGKHNNYLNSKGKLIHVHGTVEKDMVLGVHDETQIANLECFKSVDKYYLAQLIKSQTDAVNEENTYSQTFQILDSSDLIYIYGMSLGETDKLWWESICKLLQTKTYLRVIIHSHGAPLNELLNFERRRHEDAQRNRLFDFGNVDEKTRTAIQSRVHVTGANIFEALKDIAKQRDSEAKAS
ncbi:MAG: hypothetical protein J1F66_02570 [Clostridiales bacterium]|nr:hypothetical protein [Clostridiales bacterium]